MTSRAARVLIKVRSSIVGRSVANVTKRSHTTPLPRRFGDEVVVVATLANGYMSSVQQRLIVPVNGSEGDSRALALVGDLYNGHQVSITLIYVVEVQQSMPLDAELPAEIDRGEVILHRAEELAKSIIKAKHDRLTTDLLQARSAGAAIVDEAIERHAEAIVMSTSNRIKHGKIGIGETTAYVLKNASCEVIVARLAQPD